MERERSEPAGVLRSTRAGEGDDEPLGVATEGGGARQVEQLMVELPARPSEPAPNDEPAAIELEIGGRYVLRLRVGTDSTHLREVIEVLEAGQ